LNLYLYIFPTFCSVFQAVSFKSSGWMAASCPIGMRRLSCYLANTQTSIADTGRSANPLSTYGCHCNEWYGAECIAWCTNVPIPNFEIIRIVGIGNTTVPCSSGKQAMGCSVLSTGPKVEQYKWMYPGANGASCIDYEYNGGKFYATCASNISNYEIVSITGSGLVTVTCIQPGNVVLGCGSNPYQPWGANTAADIWRVHRPLTPNSCGCTDAYGTKCFAVCGKLW